MGQRLALIIGNSSYQDSTLSRLLTPDADVGALGEILLEPELGGFDDVNVLVNMSSHIIRRAIASFFSKKAREDLLLLYFSGHGVLDDQGLLYLAVRDTDSKLLRGTAISAHYINEEMNNSRSQRQVLVLDCCHSGAFARGSKGKPGASVGTAPAFEGSGFGRVVLTASDATQYAWEGDQVIGEAESSLFTHYILEGIRTGAADLNSDGRITVDELYDYVYEQVVRQTPKQTPGKWSYKEQGDIVIAQVLEGSMAISSPASRLPEFDPTLEERLRQLYNEGLSAFWLQEWDKAVRCFQAIMEVRPDYPDAANKLELSKRQKFLLTLYNQAVDAEDDGDWLLAVSRLEELLSQQPDYEDAPQRLERAKRNRLLADLYAEARQLSQAEKWRAVVSVFAQINNLQPDYPDPQGLLAAAQGKVAEIKRQAGIEQTYTNALRAMEAGDWETAEGLLLQLQADEPGYRGAERLLERAQAEKLKNQAARQREERITLLSQQAQGLARALQWREVLAKIDEIRAIDPDYEDHEGLASKAREQLQRQEQEAALQTQLAEQYAAAVRHLEAGEYQKALEVWGEVQALDPRYPDRQKVAKTASRKLKELSEPKSAPGRLPKRALVLLGTLGVAVIIALTYWGLQNWDLEALQEKSLSALGIAPTATRTPTRTPRPSATATALQMVSDDFDNHAFDGHYNTAIWGEEVRSDPEIGTVHQEDGKLVFTSQGKEKEIGLYLNRGWGYRLNQKTVVEGKISVEQSSYGAHLGFYVGFPGEQGYTECQFQTQDVEVIHCWTYFFGINQDLPIQPITPGSWHRVRIEISELDPITFDYYVDERHLGRITPERADEISKRLDGVLFHLVSYAGPEVTGYLDEVYFGPKR